LLGNLIQQKFGTITWNMVSNERISLMPEGLGLYPRLSGYENMRLKLLSANIKVNEQTNMYLLGKIRKRKSWPLFNGYEKTAFTRLFIDHKSGYFAIR
jgi:hypothetical protein